MRPSVSPFTTTCVVVVPRLDEPHFSTLGSGMSSAPATTADDGNSTGSPIGRRPRFVSLRLRLYQVSDRTDTPARCAIDVIVSPFLTELLVNAARSDDASAAYAPSKPSACPFGTRTSNF